MPPRDSITVTDVQRERKLTPKPPPNPVLQKEFNWHGTVEDFNRRVEQIHRAHEDAVGYKPTGGLVHDVARSSVEDGKIPRLFSLPRTRKAVVAQSYAVPRIGEDVSRGYVGKTVTGLTPEEQRMYLGSNPEVEAERFGNMTGPEQRAFIASLAREPKERRAELLNKAQTHSMGVAPEEPLSAVAKGIGIGVQGLMQFWAAIPLGVGGILLAEGRAAKHSVEQRSLKPVKTENVKLGKAVWEGLKEEAVAVAPLVLAAPIAAGKISHGGSPVKAVSEAGDGTDWDYIAENIGFLTWDVLGGATLGSKAGGRVRAVKAEPTAKGKRRAALYGEAPKTQELVSPGGGIKVDALLSETPAVAAVQKGIRQLRANHAQKRHDRMMSADSEAIPEAYIIEKGNPVGRSLHRWFGWERKLGRELQRLSKFEQDLFNVGADNLRTIAGWDQNFKAKLGGIPEKIKRGLSRAETMAIYVDAIDQPGGWAAKAALAREALERNITLGLGPEEMHRIRLADLGVAEKIMQAPRPRLLAALDGARSVSRETTVVKRRLGLSDEAANRRIFAVGATLRGEVHSKAGGRKELAALRKNLKEGRGDSDAIKARIADIKAQLPSAPANIGKLRETIGRLEKREQTPEVRARIEGLRAKIGEAEELLKKQVPLTDDAYYVPLVPLGKQGPKPTQSMKGLRLSPLGIGRRTVKMYFPEMFDEFTGAVLWRGDWSGDIAHLLADRHGAAVTSSQILNTYRIALADAHPNPRSVHDVAILKPDAKHWPEEYKAMLNRIEDAGQLTGEEMRHLSSPEFKRMTDNLFPGKFKNGKMVLKENFTHEDVLFVDRSFLPPNAYLQPVPNWFKRPLSAVNEPFVFAALYSRLAYLLNLVGAGTSATHYQGLLLVWKNTAEAVALRHNNPELYGAMRTMVGGGRAASYADRPFVSRFMKKGAGLMNAVTDQDFRIGTGLYYAKKHGVEDLGAFVKKARAGDEAAQKVVKDIRDRANKAMGEIDNLGFVESEAFREAAFIYTWRRAMLLWSLRAPLERPATTAVLGHIGQEELENLERFFERAPGWFKTAGFMPFEFAKDGSAVVLNPSTYTNFADLGAALRGQVVGTVRDLGPVASFIVGGLKGSDEFGVEYPHADVTGGAWFDSAAEALTVLPYVSQTLNRKESQPLPPLDVTDRKTLLTRLDAALEQTVLSPAWLDGYGTTISGGFTPRKANQWALMARWYRDASPEDRRVLEKELIDRAIVIQEKFLGRKLPSEAREALDLHFAKDKDFRAYVVERGSDTTLADRARFEIEWMRDRDLLTDKEAAAELKQLKQLDLDGDSKPEQTDINEFRGELHEKYIDPTGAVREWDISVRRVNALATPAVVNERLRRLTESGVNDAAAASHLTRPQLREYGLKADRYAKELAARLAELEEVSERNPDAFAAAKAELVAWKSEQDKPVVIGGVKLPSPARIEWASDWNYEKRAENVARKATKDWAGMTRFEKELLGRKSSAEIAKGWATFRTWADDYVNSKPVGERKLNPGDELYYAKQVNKTTPGFLQDWLFSREPLVRRLQQFRPVQQSPNRRDWDRVLGHAVTYANYLKDDRYSKSGVRDSWADYVESSLQPWVDSRPAFKEELSLYSPTLLKDLIS